MTFALENHIPYLERPFANDASISGWVIKQVPLEHGIEARGMFNSMSAAEKNDPRGVASRIVEIMAQARDPLEELKAGSLSDRVKRRQDNCVVKKKVRCVLCGNQVVASAQARLEQDYSRLAHAFTCSALRFAQV